MLSLYTLAYLLRHESISTRGVQLHKSYIYKRHDIVKSAIAFNSHLEHSMKLNALPSRHCEIQVWKQRKKGFLTPPATDSSLSQCNPSPASCKLHAT